MNYIELDIIIEPKEQASDVLIAQLAEIGFESFVETDKGFEAYIQEKEFNERQLNSTLSFYTDRYKINYTTKVIPPQNWNKEWESNFNPINVENKCYIRAPFHEPPKGFIYDVVIEPKMSFGTGHHATTQLMVQQVMKLDIANKAVLDMGCGTGVLAILAAMMGANPITAVDIDEWSYENTIENCEKNNINSISVYKGNAQILADRRFHTIFANINKNVLLQDLNTYASVLEKTGNLLISGFFETDVKELTSKAAELGLTLKNKVTQEQWTVLHFIN